MHNELPSVFKIRQNFWHEVNTRINALQQYTVLYPTTLHVAKLDRMATCEDTKVVRELANCLFDNCLGALTGQSTTMTGIPPAILTRGEINDYLAIMIQLNQILTIVDPG